MRLAAVAAVAMLVVGCASYFREGAGLPITSQRAIQVASDELRRHGITLSPRWRVGVSEDVAMTEGQGNIPLYVVSFHAPGGKFGIPHYRVFVYKLGGGVYDFLDSVNLRR